MIYKTCYCPHCGQVVHRSTNEVKSIGNPFRECYHCHRIYQASNVEEWITKSPFRRFTYCIHAGIIARALLFPAFSLASINSLGTAGAIILYICLIFVWISIEGFLRYIFSRKAIEESLERTRNPNYLMRLKNAGYDIYPIKAKNDIENVSNLNIELEDKFGINKITCPICNTEDQFDVDYIINEQDNSSINELKEKKAFILKCKYCGNPINLNRNAYYVSTNKKTVCVLLFKKNIECTKYESLKKQWESENFNIISCNSKQQWINESMSLLYNINFDKLSDLLKQILVQLDLTEKTNIYLTGKTDDKLSFEVVLPNGEKQIYNVPFVEDYKL